MGVTVRVEGSLVLHYPAVLTVDWPKRESKPTRHFQAKMPDVFLPGQISEREQP